MKFADYKAFEMTADAVEKDMENFDRLAKTADAMHLDHAQFEAWAKLHHYDLVRCSHEPYAAYRSDLTNAALAGWRGANGEVASQATEKSEPAHNFALILDRNYDGEGLSLWTWNGENYSGADGDCLSPDPDGTLDGYTVEWLTDYQLEQRLNAVRATAPQATAPTDERAAFEEWAKDQGFPIGQSDVGDGLSYLDLRTQGAFDAWQARATAPQPDHYQQLLGVAYVVLGCLAANGVDIPVRFLDAFADPDSVENPLELLPCDFSPAQAVRAVVAQVGPLTDRQIEKGWHATFSTSNPYCPCNLKSFTKAVRWAEHAISAASKEPS